MTVIEDIIIPGFITVALVAVWACIIAGAVRRTTPWARCPKCGVWHNDIGETQNHFPESGKLIAEQIPCGKCHVNHTIRPHKGADPL